MSYDSLSHLRELARIVNTAMPVRRLVLAREDSHDKNIYGQFFNALMSSDYQSEDEIAQALLNVPSGHVNYKMAKSRFKTILLNTLFHLDLKSAGRSEWSQKQHDIRRAALQGRTAMSWDSRELAKSIAIGTLKEAVLYEQWYDAMGLAMVLVSIEALEGNSKGHDKYWREYERIRIIEYDDALARKRMDELMIPFAKSGSEKPELASLARKYMLKAGLA